MSELKVIIAGGRDFDDYQRLECVMWGFQWDLREIQIVSGTARGADRLGEQFAMEYQVNLHQMPADWDKHGRAAGPIRNAAMALYADVLIAFWDGRSKGTLSMITLALDAGLEIHVYRYDPLDKG